MILRRVSQLFPTMDTPTVTPRSFNDRLACQDITWKEVDMRRGELLAVLAVFCCSLCTILAASTGPDDRPLTDPKSVVSTSNAAARPAPIDDLYYTRSVFGAAWSPDGKQIVYEQDHAGDELWDLYAIPSDGGEIINLTKTPAIREQDPHWSH